MSLYIEPLILFLAGFLLYPANVFQPSAVVLYLVIITLICCQILFSGKRTTWILTGISAVLCLKYPSCSVFLPALVYVPFYRGKYVQSAVFIMPCAAYLCMNHSMLTLLFPLLGAFSFYLAYHNRKRQELIDQNHKLRDNAVEQENALRTQNARLITRQNDQIYIATLQERNRIAREIHDNVGHMLSRSLLQVGALLAICKDETLRPLLSDLKNTLNEAMDNIRSSVHDLHDESIDLEQSLTSLCENFTFCPIRLDCEISKTIPKEIKYTFITIARESLNNIIKHSNADHVSIIIKEHPAFYQLLIEDNGTCAAGQTYDPSSENGSSGIGLHNMYDRVRALNGIFKISTNKGFRIFISIPK